MTRALDALVHSGRRDERWAEPVRALIAHPAPEVRRAALLALTRLPPAWVGARRLQGIVERAREPLPVRRAALLAFARHGHPSVRAALYRLVGRPGHPMWDVTVSRLADVGDAFALTLLPGLELEATQAAVRDAALVRLREREAAADRERLAAEVRDQLVRAAWMDVAGDPFAASYRVWLRDRLAVEGRAPMDEVRTRLHELRREAPPAALSTAAVPGPRERADVGADDVMARVRALADAWLAR